MLDRLCSSCLTIHGRWADRRACRLLRQASPGGRPRDTRSILPRPLAPGEIPRFVDTRSAAGATPNVLSTKADRERRRGRRFCRTLSGRGHAGASTRGRTRPRSMLVFTSTASFRQLGQCRRGCFRSSRVADINSPKDRTHVYDPATGTQAGEPSFWNYASRTPRRLFSSVAYCRNHETRSRRRAGAGCDPSRRHGSFRLLRHEVRRKLLELGGRPTWSRAGPDLLGPDTAGIRHRELSNSAPISGNGDFSSRCDASHRRPTASTWCYAHILQPRPRKRRRKFSPRIFFTSSSEVTARQKPIRDARQPVDAVESLRGGRNAVEIGAEPNLDRCPRPSRRGRCSVEQHVG